MAKPERYPWPYGPQWNYYPPHMLDFSKLPFPNGPLANNDPNENYMPIRCPEPRRAYHIPYSSFSSYYHQDNHPVHPYMQSNTIYSPKQYLYRPLHQENVNSSYKVPENLHSFSACSNYSLTKDQSTCYQTTWNNTSHFQRNPPELDVRHFLATWQDKDDDFVDVAQDNEQTQVYQGNDSIPLDCTKRNSKEKSVRKSCNDNLLSGQTLSGAGYIVQPYYMKDETASYSRQVVTEELNNNNLFYKNNHNYACSNQNYSKNYIPNAVKFPNSKLVSCDYSLSYNHPLNHCDQSKNSLNQSRPKDIVMEPSERSQYNLTSSLESGELFCDINPRNEEIQKPPIIHPMYNDSLHKGNSGVEQCYFENDHNEFPENLMLTDFHTLKDSWDMFSSNVKVKDNTKVSPNLKSINKVSPQNLYEQFLPNNNNNNNNSSINANSVACEGAFNITSNLVLNNSSSHHLNGNNCLLPSHDSLKPTVPSQPVASSKFHSNINKTVQANTKIRPYQFNEEISSDDIDISIASSGDLIIEDDHSSICCTSVISFSKMKKEKSNNVLPKDLKNNNLDKRENCSSFSSDKKINSPKPQEVSDDKLIQSLEQKCDKSIEPENDCMSNVVVKNLSSLKSDVIDLSVLKDQTEKTITTIEKDPVCYLDISSNHFETSNLEQKISHDVSNLSPTGNELPVITSDRCENSDNKEETSSIIHDNKVDSEYVREPDVCISKESSNVSDTPDKLLDKNNAAISNDNLLLLAHCSQEYGCQIRKENSSSHDYTLIEKNKIYSENHSKSVRDSVIKCSLRWDRIFNIMSNEDNLQPDVSLDLGPAKVELRMPPDSSSSNQWKIVEADNKIQTSSIVQVKRLILKRKNRSEERIPKMIIKKTEGQEYRSYLKNESSKAVLNCEKLKIYRDTSSNSPKNQIPET